MKTGHVNSPAVDVSKGVGLWTALKLFVLKDRNNVKRHKIRGKKQDSQTEHTEK